jgi:hypothetical protein
MGLIRPCEASNPPRNRSVQPLQVVRGSRCNLTVALRLTLIRAGILEVAMKRFRALMRFDTASPCEGPGVAACGFRGRTGGFIREYLLFAYRIPGDGVYASEGVSHEVKLFMLHPSEGIDYRVSVLKQKNLRPLTPSAAGFQFYAADDFAAWDRVRSVAEFIYDHEQWHLSGSFISELVNSCVGVSIFSSARRDAQFA